MSRRRRIRFLTAGIMIQAMSWSGAPAAASAVVEFHGSAGLEGTAYAVPPADPRQNRHDISVAVRPTVLIKPEEPGTSFTGTLFLRWDAADSERTHGDIRELKLDHRLGNVDLTAGVDTVFWGKTEAVHLADIINQADAVESLKNDEKLGQPMLRLSTLTEYGRFAAYYLPYFRERTFPGPEGRRRTQPPVNDGAADYRSSQEEWYPSFALRWARALGDYDLGLSAFHGMSRDPGFRLSADGSELIPIYGDISQVAFDGQYIAGPTLYKLETIWRLDQYNLSARRQNYAAATGGVEHTLYGVAGSEVDLGLIAEYAWDARRLDTTSPYQNDIILGTRLTFNDAADSSLLATAVIDILLGGTLAQLEAQTRVSDHLSLSVKGLLPVNINDRDLNLYGMRKDASLRVTLTSYW
jgi:hypothetical protein